MIARPIETPATGFEVIGDHRERLSLKGFPFSHVSSITKLIKIASIKYKNQCSDNPGGGRGPEKKNPLLHLLTQYSPPFRACRRG